MVELRRLNFSIKLILPFIALSNTWVSSVYAAGSFLTADLVHGDKSQDVLGHVPTKDTICSEPLKGPIETTLCNYETVESVNDELYDNLRQLVQTQFFKFYKVDLYRECPFWQENGFCMRRECGVSTLDESQIPEKWRAAALSQIVEPSEEQKRSFPGCYSRDTDFCFLDDDETADANYIDLTLNPERFTGYAGASTQRVWRAIYEENCFGLSEMSLMTSPNPAPVSLPRGFDSVFEKGDGTLDGECLEKRVYYRIISGLHASISTHICHQSLDQMTGQWGPNLDCFIERVASHPERLQYIYFNTVILLRALSRLEPYLSDYDLCAGEVHTLEHDQSKCLLSNVLDIAKRVGAFDETVLFRGENAKVLKEEFKDHFRNVSRIMDCVGCDACRLWGKVQVTGVATALKILFEMDHLALNPRTNKNLLQRSEVVAMINTLHRFSESLHATEEFRKIWAERESRNAVAKPDPPQPTPPPRTGDNISSIPIVERVHKLWMLCKHGAEECIQVAERAAKGAISAASTVFAGSGKDEFPGRTEL